MDRSQIPGKQTTRSLTKTAGQGLASSDRLNAVCTPPATRKAPMSNPATLSDREREKRAAQSLLRRGLASYAEIAGLTGRSRQLVRLWATSLNAETARDRTLARIWRKTLLEVKPIEPVNPPSIEPRVPSR
jgi:hypothetical protein